MARDSKVARKGKKHPTINCNEQIVQGKVKRKRESHNLNNEEGLNTKKVK